MTRPAPRDVTPDDLDAPFWEGCASGVFLLHRCGSCGRAYWPASTCLDHGSTAMDWTPASGRGSIHTFTVVRHGYDPAFPPPYVVAVIELDEGPFFHTDLLDCDPEDVRVGMRVAVVFEERDDVTIPHFRPLRPEETE